MTVLIVTIGIVLAMSVCVATGLARQRRAVVAPVRLRIQRRRPPRT